MKDGMQQRAVSKDGEKDQKGQKLNFLKDHVERLHLVQRKHKKETQQLEKLRTGWWCCFFKSSKTSNSTVHVFKGKERRASLQRILTQDRLLCRNTVLLRTLATDSIFINMHTALWIIACG